MLGASSNTVHWTVFQILGAAGTGMVITLIPPAVQVELPESDVALSAEPRLNLGCFHPAAIFNNRFEQLSVHIDDGAVRDSLRQGLAYERPRNFHNGTIRANTDSGNHYIPRLALTSLVNLHVFATLGFLVAWGLRETEMRKTLETEFDLKQKPKSKSSRF